jgi:acyl-CoA thioesterase-1
LEGIAEVYCPAENCRFAKYTLWCLGEWLILGGGKYDIIHWNNGIWDAFIPDHLSEPFTVIDDYLRDMMKVFEVLKKTGAKIIFAATTAVKPDLINTNNSRIEYYNSCIISLLKVKNVIINDLYTPVKEHLNEYIADDNLHLSEAGIKALGGIVAEKIKESF